MPPERHPVLTWCSCPRSSHMEIWTLLLRALVGWTFFAQCLARQWIHVPRQFLEASERISIFLRAGVDLDPVVNSRPALRSCSMEKCVRSMLRFHGLLELMALGIWTLFHRPLYQTGTWSLSQDCVMREGSFRCFFAAFSDSPVGG